MLTDRDAPAEEPAAEIINLAERRSKFRPPGSLASRVAATFKNIDDVFDTFRRGNDSNG